MASDDYASGGPPKRSPGAGPDFLGFGSYGPWPDNDPPQSYENPSPHFRDGYQNRAPAGTHQESPTEYWLDCLTYPERTTADGDYIADVLDARSRDFRVSLGQLTGRKVGPAE